MTVKRGQSASKYKTGQLSTPEKLRLSFLELLADRPFQLISVKELVARAGHSRSTFYSHFPSKLDVLLSGHRLIEHGSDPVREMFHHARENFETFQYLERDGLEHKVQEHFVEALQAHQPWRGSVDVYQARFLSAGLYGVLTHWLRSGCPEPLPGMSDLRRWRGL